MNKKLLVLLFSATLLAFAANRTPRVTIDSHDRILPHLIAGGGYWTSTITLVNVDSRPGPYTLRFYDDAGVAWSVPFQGIGNKTSVTGTLAPGASVSFTTSTDGPQVAGWAELSDDWSTAAIAMWGVFRMTAGAQIAEAVVPTSRDDDTTFAVPFDNTNGMLLGLGIANPGDTPVTADFVFTGEDGAILDKRTLTLPGKGHTAFQTRDQWSILAGKKGAIWVDVQAGQGLAVLGLRFNPTSFTSIHTVYAYQIPHLPQ
jgi:hypothetical protein